ncbi:MAG: helix-turn-helix transcriptional regulator [Pseudomonadota bacterium]
MSERLASFFQRAKQSPKYKSKMRQAEVSADLRLLIAESGKNFKDISTAIGISQAALSKKLGGEANLTLDSISAIAEAVGADFDIVFRHKEATRALQMWESAAITVGMLEKASALLEEVAQMHTRIQARDRTSTDLLRARYRQGVTSGYRMEQVAINDENIGRLVAANGG